MGKFNIGIKRGPFRFLAQLGLNQPRWDFPRLALFGLYECIKHVRLTLLHHCFKGKLAIHKKKTKKKNPNIQLEIRIWVERRLCCQDSVKMLSDTHRLFVYLAIGADWLKIPLLLISTERNKESLTSSDPEWGVIIRPIRTNKTPRRADGGVRSSIVDQRAHPESRRSSHRTQLKKKKEKASIFHQTTLSFWSRSKPRLPQSYR